MKHKSIVENVAKIIFTVCAVVAIFAVLSITIYMFLKGAPAFFKVGVLNLLFGTKWAPTAADPSYGILYIILTSILGTAVSILIGVPIALLTAVFLTEVSNKKLSAVVQPAVELLAAIPSVIYGLLGLMILNPVLYKLEKHIFSKLSNTSVYRRIKSACSNHSACNHDSSYGNQHERIINTGSTAADESGIPCSWSNKDTDNI